MPAPAWYPIENVAEVPSPALLVYPDRVRRNIDRMIARAGDVRRLRPHVKTHKSAEVVKLKLAAGITKVKAATLAEAEMCADGGMPEVLLSFPQIGPNVDRLLRLTQAFPKTKFATISDDHGHLHHLSAVFAETGRTIEVWLDIDAGQHRSGVEPGDRAFELYRLMDELPGTDPGGLHVYDGHVRERDLSARIELGESSFAAVAALEKKIVAAGLPMKSPCCGGTPTFPVHARHADRDYCPGTCVYWDASYAGKFPDLEFEFACLLLGRVVSKPGGDRLCIDLGYKSVSPDNPTVRVELLGLGEVKWLGQWEEHLAVETAAAANLAVGDPVYGVPFHVCPTVALHREVHVVENGRVTDTWPVTARDRRLNY